MPSIGSPMSDVDEFGGIVSAMFTKTAYDALDIQLADLKAWKDLHDGNGEVADLRHFASAVVYDTMPVFAEFGEVEQERVRQIIYGYTAALWRLLEAGQ